MPSFSYPYPTYGGANFLNTFSPLMSHHRRNLSFQIIKSIGVRDGWIRLPKNRRFPTDFDSRPYNSKLPNVLQCN